MTFLEAVVDAMDIGPAQHLRSHFRVNPLSPLTPAQLAALPGLSARQIDEALERGRADAAAARSAVTPGLRRRR